jgi:hypothetical protein
MKIAQSLCGAGVLLFLAITGSSSNAADTAVNPAGTWELKTLNATNQPPSLLILKLEDGKLTGTLSRNAGSKVEQLPLEDAQLKGSEISFAVRVYALEYKNNVLQPTDTNKVTHSTFQGRISGDTIKGKVEKKSWVDETSRTLDWEAKRVKK